MTRIPADQRRRELVDAGLRVMARDGIAATTTRAVVAEAGMPLGAFHYCFRSKQELLREMTAAAVEQEALAAAAVLQPGNDVHTTIRDGLRMWWALVTQNPGQQQGLYELTQYALRTPELNHVATEQYGIYRSAAGTLLASLAETGDIVWDLPLDLMARMLVAVLDGVLLGWLVDRDDSSALATFDVFAGHLAGHARPRNPAG